MLLLYSLISLTDNLDEIFPTVQKEQAEKNVEEITFPVKDSGSIKIRFLIQPEHQKHLTRLKKITTLTLKYLEENIGKYPYDGLVIFDNQNKNETIKLNNTTTVRLDLDYILPEESFEFEMSVASKIASKYFGKIIKPVSENDVWLNYGLSRYIAHKIIEKNYPPQMNVFHLVGYLPIYGIRFLSYNEIPIIYTLRYFNVPLESSSLKKYYEYSNTVPITGKNKDALNNVELEVKNVHKPYLLMLSLDRYFGEMKTLEMLSNYYNENKNRFADKINFEEKLFEITSVDSVFNSSVLSLLNDNLKYDYAVDSLINKGEDEWEIIASRKEAGKYPVDIFAYTEKDTLIFKWDGNSVHKKIKFKSENKVIAVELDPKHKNIFDLNYANNSYMLETDYTTSVSVAIRWFFWIQNAIIIIGSVG